MKTCKKCGEQKEMGAFYAHPFGADGKMSSCIECQKASVKARRRLDGEKIRERDRARGSRQSPEYRIAWRKKNEAAYRAQTAVGNAVRDGKLFKEPCLFCGDENVHAHHDDYSRPLDVRWLCPKCHRRLHANFGHKDSVPAVVTPA